MVSPHLFLAGEARVAGGVAHLDSASKAFCVTDNRGSWPHQNDISSSDLKHMHARMRECVHAGSQEFRVKSAG